MRDLDPEGFYAYNLPMVSTGTSCFEGSGGFKPASLKEQMPGGYTIIPSEERTLRGTLLDTFDGHLRQSGKVLLQLEKEAVLLDLSTGLLLAQPAARGWCFAEQIKGGVVGLELRQISRLRAFLPLCDISIHRIKYAVLDKLEKTVARIGVCTLTKGRRETAWVTVPPLRGYTKESDRVRRGMIAAGFSAVERPSDFFPRLGIRHEPYTSRPEIALDPQAPVYTSAGTIVTAFLDVARVNEPGIRDDLDTEFLHDYRVSLRRVRSLMTLFKGIYSEPDSQRIKAALADIMKQTNRLRDLDVYLLDRNRYYKLVPSSMHAGLDVMFDVFARERQEALEQVTGLLRKPAYRRGMKALQHEFSKADALGRGSAADEETLHFARRLVLKRYRKVAGIALAIREDTPDATVHELRIQCKKLRYLMEFFIPLCRPDAIRPLVKSLKGLQDVLGRFNDFSVQREALAAFVEQHPMRGKKGLMLAESVGALVAILYQLQLKARGEVELRIASFVNDRTRRRFNRVFSNKE